MVVQRLNIDEMVNLLFILMRLEVEWTSRMLKSRVSVPRGDNEKFKFRHYSDGEALYESKQLKSHFELSER